MKLKYFHIVCILFLLGFGPAKAQDLAKEFDAIYGLNPKLYNGKVHSDFYNPNVKGNQFLYSKDFVSGSLEVNQQTYYDKQINYDIYKQKLLLSFQDQNQANRIIEIPLIHLESFSMENKYFKLIAWDDSTRRIFQQIGENDIQILIYWFKELNAISSTDNYNYQFTDAKKQIWILKEGDFHQVTNNKNFRKLFPAEKQTELKKWMKSQRIKIQKSGDINLDLLIKYCENL